MKKKWLWTILFVLILGLTIWAIVSQSGSFDWDVLLCDLKNSNKFWLIIAFVTMFANIFFEALALKSIIRVICPEYKNKGRYLLYSSADNYFSAITPFTSGGQPAMVLFMAKDKIPAAGITISLILDYIACTLINLLSAIIGLIFVPKFITTLSTLTIVAVILGAVFLIIINIALYILLTHSNLFKKIATAFLKFGNKLFHFKEYEKRLEKIDKVVNDYKQCSLIMKQNKKMVIKVFLLTLIQKLGKTLTSVFVFFAVIKNYEYGFKVFFIQVLSELGSFLVPLPGGIGAREYILIDGFNKLPIIENPANLGLMCESISFYLGILLSGLIVLFAILIRRRKNKLINKQKDTNN